MAIPRNIGAGKSGSRGWPGNLGIASNTISSTELATRIAIHMCGPRLNESSANENCRVVEFAEVIVD